MWRDSLYQKTVSMRCVCLHCLFTFILPALHVFPSNFNHQGREEANFRLSLSDFVQRAVLVVSCGKAIMKLSHCQQPYWIDRLETEGTLCLKLAKPVELRSDDSVCRWQKYPWHCMCVWVCALACRLCVHAEIHLVGDACLQKSRCCIC